MRGAPTRWVAVAAGALVLTGCAPSTTVDDAGAASATAPAIQATAPAVPTDQPTTDAQTPDPLSCEALLPATMVESLTARGWSSVAAPFYIDSTELPGGISCTWGELGTTSTNVVQLYGWAPIEHAEAARLEAELLAETRGGGWRKETSDQGTYVTAQDPSQGTVDSDGYGLTYLFGDGWVTFSDTKQGLLLITPP